MSPEEEARYLAAGNKLFAEIATVLVDSGLRPEECNRLAWDSLTWVNGRHGTSASDTWKDESSTANAPMTPRVRALLQARWEDRWKAAQKARCGQPQRRVVTSSRPA